MKARYQHISNQKCKTWTRIFFILVPHNLGFSKLEVFVLKGVWVHQGIEAWSCGLLMSVKQEAEMMLAAVARIINPLITEQTSGFYQTTGLRRTLSRTQWIQYFRDL